MEESVISLLEDLRPLVKRRWEALLRAAPVASALASPDTLVYLMDETLDQLVGALRARSVKSWLHRNKALLAPLRTKCTCGINPLLAYYTTGSEALRDVAAEPLGPAFGDAHLLFHSLAQKDIEALCGVCPNQGAASCAQRRVARAGARHAARLGVARVRGS